MDTRSYADSVLSTFTAGDGGNVAVQYWPVADDVPRRGMVVVVHGLGEHAGRHERLAQRLVDWGYSVIGYDQVGHGESEGVRGCLPTTLRLIEDLDDIARSARNRLKPGEKLIVIGHSMGGLVAACWVLLRQPRIDGLVLSSPALRISLGPMERLMLALLLRVAPNFRVAHGVRPEGLSHDPEVVEAYQADPLVHDRISARLARFIAEAGPRVLARAGRWAVPTLLLYSGRDAIVDPRGSRTFAAQAPPGIVEAHAFDDLFHEVFNELEAEPVYAALKSWLERRP